MAWEEPARPAARWRLALVALALLAAGAALASGLGGGDDGGLAIDHGDAGQGEHGQDAGASSRAAEADGQRRDSPDADRPDADGQSPDSQSPDSQGPDSQGPDSPGPLPDIQALDDASALPAAKLPGAEGLVLYAFRQGRVAVRVLDLGTGDLRQVDLSGPWQPAWSSPRTTQDALVVTVQSSPLPTVYAHPSGMEGSPVGIGQGEEVIGIDEHSVWLMTHRFQERGIRIVRARLDGRGAIGSYELPMHAWPLGVAPDGLVLDLHGRVVVHDPDSGSGHLLAVGQGIAVAGEHFSWLSCDPALTCEVLSARLDEPTARLRAPFSAGGSSMRWDASHSLSPTGTHVATSGHWDNGRAPIVVVDLEEGHGVEVPGSVSPHPGGHNLSGLAPWSPDGEWLFVPAADGGVVAWHAPTQRAHLLPLAGEPPDALAVH